LGRLLLLLLTTVAFPQGVSNYTVEDYKELMESEGVTVVPVVNQIEINPFLYRKVRKPDILAGSIRGLP